MTIKDALSSGELPPLEAGFTPPLPYPARLPDEPVPPNTRHLCKRPFEKGATQVMPPNARKPAAAGRRRRIKGLERELQRKDRALAETATLLVLSKKPAAVFHKDEDA